MIVNEQINNFYAISIKYHQIINSQKINFFLLDPRLLQFRLRIPLLILLLFLGI